MEKIWFFIAKNLDIWNQSAWSVWQNIFGHKVLDVEEEQKQNLLNDIDSVTEILERKKVMISAMKGVFEKKSEACVVKLRRTKQEMVEQLDKMIQKMEDQRKLENTTIEDEIAVKNENVSFLKKHKEE